MPDKQDSASGERTYAHRLRRVLFCIFIAALILLPTVLAIINAAYVDSGISALSARASEVMLYDAEGNRLYGEHESENLSGDGSLISIFNMLYEGLTEVDEIPDNVLKLTPVRADIAMHKEKKTLVCYFSLGDDDAFCTDEQGNSYIIRSVDRDRFLRSRFAEILYSDSVAPTLTGGDGLLIAPTNINWNYQNTSGAYMTADLNMTQAGGITYTMAGALSFSFSMPPTSAYAQVLENGILVFEGNIDELQSLILNTNSSVKILMQANWEQSAQLSYYGSLEYDFSVYIHSRAAFSLSTDQLSIGEFALLTATNISDASKLSFSIDGNRITPEILLDGDTAYALFPYSAPPSGSDSFCLTASYGVSSYDFTVSLMPSDTSATVDQLSSAANAFGLTPEKLGTIKSQYSFLFYDTVSPETTDYRKSASFGQLRTEDGQEALCFYTEYEALSLGGSSVHALTSGLVCEIGENENIGKYVAVDLGLGMHLTYFNLSYIDTRVGAYLAVGDTVGKCGSLSLDNGEGFSLMLSCGEAILDAEKILG